MSIFFILLGISVIFGLMKSGQVGKAGGCLMIVILLLIIGAGVLVFLFTIGGALL